MVAITPWIAGAAFVAYCVSVALSDGGRRPNAWLLPAALSVAFLAYSLWAIAVEGPLGFWTEHTRNLWGNQIWFDLLLAVAIGWTFVAPQARALGMRLVPWLLLVVGTGCVGFTAMTARLLYLQERRAAQPAAPSR
jgi:hypothetical protein